MSPSFMSAPLAWARVNLVRTKVDTVITLVAGSFALFLLYRVVRFVLFSGRWEIARVNLALFMVGTYDRDQLWRPVVAVIVAGLLAGVWAGVIARRQAAARPALFGRLSPRRQLVLLAGRMWPLGLGVLVLLALTRTITPWLVTAATVIAAVAGRLVGGRLPRRVTPVVAAVTVATGVGMISLMASAQGWDRWGGLMLNLFLAATSITLCFPLGVLLALGRRSKLPVIRAVSAGYIELFRGLPLLPLLLMANVALGFFIPQSMAPGKVVRAIVVFTFFTAAYVAEIVRGGLQSLPVGQIEAGRALGLSPVRVTAMIVLPQALRNVIPALVGQFISLFKDTTLAGAAMGFVDLLAGAESATKQPGFAAQLLRPETTAVVMFVFWVGSFTMSRESQRLERKLGVGTR